MVMTRRLAVTSQNDVLRSPVWKFLEERGPDVRFRGLTSEICLSSSHPKSAEAVWQDTTSLRMLVK